MFEIVTPLYASTPSTASPAAIEYSSVPDAFGSLYYYAAAMFADAVLVISHNVAVVLAGVENDCSVYVKAPTFVFHRT
jgi:hypothetical protein